MCMKVLKERRKVCISLACVAGVTILFKQRENFKTMACQFIFLNLNFCSSEISGLF